MKNLSRMDHPNPTPAPPVVEVRPDEFIFATEYDPEEFPGEQRTRALSEHFGAGYFF